MTRAMNFNAGPAVLPLQVVEETRDAVYNYAGLGMSIMEMSHRSKEFDLVIKEAQADCLKIMGLSADDYSVLFLGGGASMQFLMIPMNFLKNKADYVNTGVWSKKAIKEAKAIGTTNVVATSEDANFNYIPKNIVWNDDADYAHITTNNTIFGTEWKIDPDTKAPLIADMSSNLFSRQLDFAKYSLIYAGAQKNIGPAGVTMIVIKKEMLEKVKENLPTMLNYNTHAKEESLFNTPPALPIYVVGRTFKWILNQGLDKIEEINAMKGNYIYDVIDTHNDFYKGAVANKEDRSYMNITWNLPTPELEAQFINEAKALNMIGLKGHRSVGGVRASVYNACPAEHCKALSDFMVEFYKKNK
jgi:phosphoserine aminotransferase